MPTYDYRRLDTGRVYEVKHPIAYRATTWGELCALGALDPGDAPVDTPVERLVSAAGVVGAGALKNPSAPPCAAANACCGGGACGIN